MLSVGLLYEGRRSPYTSLCGMDLCILPQQFEVFLPTPEPVPELPRSGSRIESKYSIQSNLGEMSNELPALSDLSVNVPTCESSVHHLAFISSLLDFETTALLLISL